MLFFSHKEEWYMLRCFLRQREQVRDVLCIIIGLLLAFAVLGIFIFCILIAPFMIFLLALL